MHILGIETSCDETAVSVLAITDNKVTVLSNIISSQLAIHKKYGGVVPELAARKHTENIIAVIDEAIKTAFLNPKIKIQNSNQNSKSKIKNSFIDVVAVTSGPGLVTSLMVGVETAKTLAWSLQVPLIPVNHLDGHISANFIPHDGEEIKKIKFPALCLLVSGGHTELVLIQKIGDYKIIGETQDDAVGEAFDKIAKMIGVEYPGGPNVASLAQQGKKGVFKLPRPMMASDNFDFSLSGLKSAVHRIISVQKKLSLIDKKNICAEFQQAVIDVLIKKTILAGEKNKVKTIMIAGGVSANIELRTQLAKKIKQELPEVDFVIPDLKYCTDNGTMIAMAGFLKYNKKMKPYNLEAIEINPNLSL
jgi:N6-L-threonylcarbamoyladenine synthase